MRCAVTVKCSSLELLMVCPGQDHTARRMRMIDIKVQEFPVPVTPHSAVYRRSSGCNVQLLCSTTLRQMSAKDDSKVRHLHSELAVSLVGNMCLSCLSCRFASVTIGESREATTLAPWPRITLLAALCELSNVS